jgi:hypothetical protein
MAKRRVESQIANLTFNHKKSGIDPIYLAAEDMRHIIRKPSMRAITLLRLHLNLRSACKVMGLQNCGSPNWRDFGTPTREPQESHLDVGSVASHRV